MMYGAMQDRVGKIEDVQILGRSFYHVEFAEVEYVMELLQLKHMDVTADDQLVQFITSFLGLGKE